MSGERIRSNISNQNSPADPPTKSLRSLSRSAKRLPSSCRPRKFMYRERGSFPEAETRGFCGCGAGQHRRFIDHHGVALVGGIAASVASIKLLDDGRGFPVCPRDVKIDSADVAAAP